MDLNYFTYAIIVVVIFTAYMAIVNIMRRDKMRARLQSAIGDSYMDDDDVSPPFIASFCRTALSMMGIEVNERKDITLLLAQAGIYSPYAASYFLFFSRVVQPIIFVIGAALFVKAVFFSANLASFIKLVLITFSIFVLLVGFYGAKLYVTNRKQRRQKILLQSFPEILDLMLVCIESGLGLDAALARVCAESRATNPVIISELDRTRIQLTLMSDRTQAIQNLADRTEIVPFKSLVSALIQTEKFGTSLLDTLRVLSDDIRTTRLMNAEARAARIPVFITIPMIFCMLPAFIIIILGPPIIRVIEQGGIFGQATPHK